MVTLLFVFAGQSLLLHLQEQQLPSQFTTPCDGASGMWEGLWDLEMHSQTVPLAETVEHSLPQGMKPHGACWEGEENPRYGCSPYP